MTRKIAAIALAGYALVGWALVGCATVHALVEPPPLKGPIASLAYDHKLLVYLLKIDGKRVFDDQVSHFDFAPGIHTLSLRFHPAPKQQTVRNGSEFDLSFDAQANHKYRIEFSINQDYSKWSAHILDLETNRRVSSIITDND
jgi:hypothetical protein